MVSYYIIVASYKPAYIYGGPIISVASVCESLVENGVNLNVLTTTANGASDFDYPNGELKVVDGVPVRYFNRVTGDNSHMSPSLYYYLFRNLKKHSIIHLQAWWNLVTVGAAIVCKLKGQRLVISPRGTLSAYSFVNRTSFAKKTFHRIIGRHLLKNAIFQVSSKKEVGDVQFLFPGAITYVIPNFVNLDGLPPAFTPPATSNVLRILFFSRIEEKKGLNFLLQALPYMYLHYTLDIYGEGDLEYIDSLKSSITEIVEPNICWKGAVYGNKKFEILGSYDVLVLPSYDENFANVVIECLAMGTPVLLTEKVGLADYVMEKDFGYLCTQDPPNIASQLHFIHNDTEKRQRIKRQAPSTIRTDFSKERLTAQYLSFYNEVETIFNTKTA